MARSRLVLVFSYLVAALVCQNATAQTKVKGTAKPSYQSIFQGYYDLASPHNRMENFTFGFAAQFATIMPFSRIGSTTDTQTINAKYAAFFNFQGKVFVRIGYYLEVYALGGLTEIEADVPIDNQNFQHATIRAFPIMLGLKYRILKRDWVPYVFAGGGMYLTTLTASEEASDKSFSRDKNALGYHAGIGVEIYVQPHFGFTFEAGLEQIHHGQIILGQGQFLDGPYTFKSKSGGLLLSSSFFIEL